MVLEGKPTTIAGVMERRMVLGGEPHAVKLEMLLGAMVGRAPLVYGRP